MQHGDPIERCCCWLYPYTLPPRCLHCSFWAPLPEGWDARHGEQALGLGQGGVAAATFTELSGSKSEGAPTPSGSSASAGSAGGGVSSGPGGAGASSSSPGGRGSAGGQEAGDGAVEDCPQLRMAAQGPREAARTGDGRMRYQGEPPSCLLCSTMHAAAAAGISWRPPSQPGWDLSVMLGAMLEFE